MAIVQQHVEAQQAVRVERVVLRVGTLAGVDVDSLHFAFEVVARGTAADGAMLEIETVPAAVYCQTCRAEFPGGAGFIFTCPGCGDLCGEIRRGRELELSRIEMS